MTRQQALKNWVFKADKDVETAEDLFNLHRYDWCLFIWHLAVEKIIKAKLMSDNVDFPYIHDLLRLAKLAKIPLDETLTKELAEITTFNLDARYDEYKLKFYKKATKEYTKEWKEKCQQIYNTIKSTIL